MFMWSFWGVKYPESDPLFAAAPAHAWTERGATRPTDSETASGSYKPLEPREGEPRQPQCGLLGTSRGCWD